MTKHQLPCCALAQLCANDTTSLEELTNQINTLKKDAKKRWTPSNRESGERSCFVVATPSEITLKDNLIKLGFVKIWEFNRRNGYPQTGLLEMFALRW